MLLVIFDNIVEMLILLFLFLLTSMKHILINCFIVPINLVSLIHFISLNLLKVRKVFFFEKHYKPFLSFTKWHFTIYNILFSCYHGVLPWFRITDKPSNTFAYWFCSPFSISIAIIPFLTVSLKACIVLNFLKSFIIFYPL